MSTLNEKIQDVLCKPQLASFATISEDGKPWVRYVFTAGDENFNVRFSTFTNSRKVKHVEKNSEVHLTLGISGPNEMGPYLQIQGTAEITTDQEERNNFWCKELEHVFKGPEDPNYAIIIVKPYKIEYESPNMQNPTEIWTQE